MESNLYGGMLSLTGNEMPLADNFNNRVFDGLNDVEMPKNATAHGKMMSVNPCNISNQTSLFLHKNSNVEIHVLGLVVGQVRFHQIGSGQVKRSGQVI